MGEIKIKAIKDDKVASGKNQVREHLDGYFEKAKIGFLQTEHK